jgi:5'-3' exonuclease
MVEFEADDALATAAARWRGHKDVEQVVICSPDKDLAQCVRRDRVVLFDRRRDRVTDEDGVLVRFGVRPHSIPDYLALVGDNADGVPGIPRWGARSSATVLHAYDHIEQIPDDSDKWSVRVRGARALASILAERREEALLYRTLTTLRIDVPIGESLDDLLWRGARRAEMNALCADLDDQDLMRLVHRWDENT